MTHAECNDPNHPSHEALLPRLNRLAGQIEGVKRMMNDRRYCPDILTQLHAVRSAIRNLEIHILDTHVSHCIAETIEMKSETKRRQKIDEIRDIIKRFE